MSSESIETNELIIKDKEGRTRIRLGMNGELPAIQVFDSNGVSRIELSLSALSETEYPDIYLNAPDGEWAVNLAVGESSDTNPDGYNVPLSEGHLYLASRNHRIKKKLRGGIDVYVTGAVPVIEFLHENNPKLYSLSVGKDGELNVEERPRPQ